jgi:hypothetical protein
MERRSALVEEIEFLVVWEERESWEVGWDL